MPNYMPQLDALRALAVAAVMFSHFHHASLVNQFIPMGGGGVRLFFVLSGFLITGILIRGTLNWGLVGRFMARRALRLLPLYFLAATIVLTYSAKARLDWGYYIGHAVNFLAAREGSWDLASGHFWSLAVEEQFYLLWPLAVLALDRRRLLQLCFAIILLSPMYRIAVFLLTDNRFYASVMLPGTADCLAAGAALAIWAQSGGQMPRYGLPLAILGSAGCIATLALTAENSVIHSVIRVGFFNTVLLPPFAWLVWRAATGFDGFIGRALEFQPLLYLGKISYGVYIIHGMVNDNVPPLYGKTVNGWLLFAGLGAISIALASLSWHLYEAPFNRLKDRFAPLSRKRSEAVAS